ncbi:MAG: penicillin acylase family protein [Candidatus Hydrothermales bacterium]
MCKRICTFIFVIFLLLIFFLSFYFHLTLPRRKGSITLEGLKDTVIVRFNEYGIPWIQAKNTHDLFFVQGFLHAQDRLFQMDIWRRICEGKLSEIFGEKLFKIDSFFRLIGIKRNSELLFKSLYPIEEEILKSYTEGVNAFIEKCKGVLPIEFLILRYFPEIWTPINSVEIGKLIGWNLNFSFIGDLIFTTIKNKKGGDILKKVLPHYPEDAPFVSDANFEKEIKEIKNISSILKNFYNFTMTSNACAIKNPTFLLNDPHLEFTFPPIWYFNILQIDTLILMGFSIPGIPLVILGKNSKIAVGVTSLSLDEGDFIKFKKEKIDTIFEEIKVKNKTKKIKILLKDNLPVIKEDKEYVFCYFWRGFLISHEYFSIYNLYLSKNVFDAKRSLREFKTPSLNFIIADNSGNILYTPCAWIERKKEISILERDSIPKDFLLPDEIPYILNPPYLFSTNNPPFRDFPYYLSVYFSFSARAKRYEKNLKRMKEINLFSLKNIQNDIKSEFSKFVLEKVFNACKKINLNKKEKKILDILEKWDHSFDKNKVEPYLYTKLILKIMEEYFKPLLGDTLYREFIDLASVPFSSFEINLKNGNINDEIIVSAFRKFAKDVKFEKYGKHAKATFKHPFSNIFILKKFFTKGPLSVSGSLETPNKMGYSPLKPLDIIEGPSMRMIVDLKNDNIYIVLPPGQSGNFIDKNSSDQLKLWEKGEYIKIEKEDFNKVLKILPK